MKSAYDWIVSEEDDEVNEERGTATKKFVRMVQLETLEECQKLLKAKIATYTSERPTSRECDICAELGAVGREIEALKCEIQEEQENEDGHE